MSSSSSNTAGFSIPSSDELLSLEPVGLVSSATTTRTLFGFESTVIPLSGHLILLCLVISLGDGGDFDSLCIFSSLAMAFESKWKKQEN